MIIKKIYHYWIKLSVILSKINTTIILFLLYFLIITPLGIISRILGNDFLKLKIDKKEKSYWIAKGKTSASKDCENQF